MLTIVRYHWVFVHCRLDSVTDEFADVTVAIFVFRVVLDDRTNVPDSVARDTLVNSHEE